MTSVVTFYVEIDEEIDIAVGILTVCVVLENSVLVICGDSLIVTCYRMKLMYKSTNIPVSIVRTLG